MIQIKKDLEATESAVVSIEENVAYITIPIKEYRELITLKAQLDILKRLTIDEYYERDFIRQIVGTKDETEEE
ncbi:MAG: hypothetical protein R3Y58_03430 [Eubacteriales bacterium]